MSKIKISSAPWFNNGNKKAVALFASFMLALIISIVFFINNEIFNFSISLLITIILLIYTLDINGVEVNYKRNLIRQYKLLPYGKQGDWIDIKKFSRVYIDYEIYFIKTISYYTTFTGGKTNQGFINEKHDRYIIYLENKNEKIYMQLSEEIDYRDAKKTAVKISNKLKLPIVNMIDERNKKRIR